MAMGNKGFERTANKGRADGYASLDQTGKVPTAQLPDMGGGGPHTHPQSDITGLDAALAGKAETSHGHTIDDVSGLQAALDAKSATSHNHDASYAAAGHGHSALPPSGGTTGQVLTKSSGSDFAYAWATPSGGGFASTVATLASDQATGANTTPVTLTGLSFSYVANSKYRIWFMGRVSPAAATTGCGFQFDVSSAVTAIDVLFFHQLANTGTLSGGHSIADDASVGVSSGLPGTSTYPVTGHGLLVTGANAGTAQLRFRSETTAVITAKAGLTMVVEKVA